ncbi:hypothetical protein [Dishui Lake phycodnavirus 4]|nr:hypothetical protein [Dishui Lake phycodnavirus 4]
MSEPSKHMNSEEFKEFYSRLQLKYKTEGITKENLCSLVISIFMEVNKYKKLSEDERKEIIISVVNEFIRTLDEGEVDSEVEVLLMSLVPNLVDSVFFTVKSSSMLKKILCCSTVE